MSDILYIFYRLVSLASGNLHLLHLMTCHSHRSGEVAAVLTSKPGLCLVLLRHHGSNLSIDHGGEQLLGCHLYLSDANRVGEATKERDSWHGRAGHRMRQFWKLFYLNCCFADNFSFAQPTWGGDSFV